MGRSRGFFTLRGSGSAGLSCQWLQRQRFVLYSPVNSANHDLDSLAQGHLLGAQPLAREVDDIRLRFGVLEVSDSTRYAAFGLKGIVETIKQGECLKPTFHSQESHCIKASNF